MDEQQLPWRCETGTGNASVRSKRNFIGTKHLNSDSRTVLAPGIKLHSGCWGHGVTGSWGHGVTARQLSNTTDDDDWLRGDDITELTVIGGILLTTLISLLACSLFPPESQSDL